MKAALLLAHAHGSQICRPAGEEAAGVHKAVIRGDHSHRRSRGTPVIQQTGLVPNYHESVIGRAH